MKWLPTAFSGGKPNHRVIVSCGNKEVGKIRPIVWRFGRIGSDFRAPNRGSLLCLSEPFLKSPSRPNPSPVAIAFDNSYVRELPGFYVAQAPEPSPDPELVYFNAGFADVLGLSVLDHPPETLAQLFSGNQLPAGAEPIAQVYAGHQFGYFNPQLGDGRALIVGEIVAPDGKRYDFNLKGSGRTPFSRGGDGKAALGPMLREVLIGEAMHALGVPTTRALAVTTTGAPVYRQDMLPGAVLTRIAASHLRIGTFQFFAARGEQDKVKQLVDYAIARHYPMLAESDTPYLDFLKAVVERQATLIAQWMGLGFIHGVMNTDNMSIAGETIDYGPCAFMDAYDPKTVFSSVDSHGRYAYQNQPSIAQWNLARFAETLLPLLADKQEAAIALATETVQSFAGLYEQRFHQRMLAKLGLQAAVEDLSHDDATLIQNWLALLQHQKVDFTNAWRKLAGAASGDATGLQELFAEPAQLEPWLARWRARCAQEDAKAADMTDDEAQQARASEMLQVNPWIIARNHLVEEALAAATQSGDLGPFAELLEALQQPFEENPDFIKFTKPADAEFTENYVTFCGT